MFVILFTFGYIIQFYVQIMTFNLTILIKSIFDYHLIGVLRICTETDARDSVQCELRYQVGGIQVILEIAVYS